MSSATPQDSGASSPPRSWLPLPVKSSPVPHIGNYIPHKHDELVQAFRYDENLHLVEDFKTSKALLQFLNVGHILPSKTPQSILAHGMSIGNFIDVANEICQSIKKDHLTSKDNLLVFKDTGNRIQLGLVTDTQCRPDITAAFEDDWIEDKITLWPCVRLAGERVSKGMTKEQQRKRAISYLHYLLLARPDLYVAQGLLARDNAILLLVGIGGHGIRIFSTLWTDPDLYKVLYAFIYRLYEPGRFADSSYIKTEVDQTNKVGLYTVRINIQERDGSQRTVDCPDLRLISAHNPFATRTHVLSNPSSKVMVGDKVLTVIKDQLCHRGTRFDEQIILSHIHGDGTVPGIIEAVHHETIVLPEDVGRIKRRLGLRQMGSPFTDIPNLQKVLETLFDLLEVLRFLRFHRNILHRDISKGNVLYLDDPPPNRSLAGTQPVEADGTDANDICFIKYLLDQSNNPQETSMLLVDFNRAEHLQSKQGVEHTRLGRTGTPLFVARAVELGEPPSFLGVTEVPAIPHSPSAYALKHPDRIQKFHPTQEVIINGHKSHSNQSQSRQWTHELDHDAESVFWLLLYWAMIVQPLRSSEEAIKSGPWSNLLGDADDRHILLQSLAQHKLPSGLIHSVYQPLGSLINGLASILFVDRQWLPECDVRNDPGYISEAFQRLILKFILDNRGQDFMIRNVDSVFRKVKLLPQSDALPATVSQKRLDAQDGKRPSPQPTTEAATKRRRTNMQRTEGPEDEETMNIKDNDDLIF